MAEGLWKELAKGDWQAQSAGSSPAGFVHPLAIRVMSEIGIDIGSQRSKHVREVAGQEFDLVVTVCDNAKESCPVLPGAKKVVHRPFDDPASVRGSDDEKLGAFRRVRDEIAACIRDELNPRCRFEDDSSSGRIRTGPAERHAAP